MPEGGGRSVGSGRLSSSVEEFGRTGVVPVRRKQLVWPGFDMPPKALTDVVPPHQGREVGELIPDGLRAWNVREAVSGRCADSGQLFSDSGQEPGVHAVAFDGETHLAFVECLRRVTDVEERLVGAVQAEKRVTVDVHGDSPGCAEVRRVEAGCVDDVMELVDHPCVVRAGSKSLPSLGVLCSDVAHGPPSFADATAAHGEIQSGMGRYERRFRAGGCGWVANPTTSRAAAREMSGQTLGITSTACMVPITTTQRADTPAARSVR